MSALCGCCAVYYFPQCVTASPSHANMYLVSTINYLMPYLVSVGRNFGTLAPVAQPLPKLVPPELLADLTSLP